MDFITTQTELNALISKLGVTAFITLHEHFDEPYLEVVATDLPPITKQGLISELEQFDGVEFNHNYSPELTQKAYDLLRSNEAQRFKDLNPDVSKLNHFDIENNGRKAVEVIQEVLNGDSKYSNQIWNENEITNADH